jgi:nitrile hydratase subunit beta
MRYRPGQNVCVAARRHEGHHRTPAYLKGKRGTVERVHARFRNPETHAYGLDGLPEQSLYLVSFEQEDIWREYPGNAGDRLYADLFEHWLEEA